MGVYISPFPQPHPLPNLLAPHALPVSLTVVPTASPPPRPYPVGDPRPSPPHSTRLRRRGHPAVSGFLGAARGWRRDGVGRGAPVARISPSGRRLPEVRTRPCPVSPVFLSPVCAVKVGGVICFFFSPFLLGGL